MPVLEKNGTKPLQNDCRVDKLFDYLETVLKIRAGYDIAFQCHHETAMALMLSIHPSRQKDLVTEHRIQFSNAIASHDYRDAFGNICTRLVAPPGLLEIRNDFVIADSGLPDEVVPDAPQWDVGALPDETLVYLLGSRYCDTEKLSDLAWSQFGGIKGGWQRVQAICDFVHNHIEFGYHHARCDRTASEGHAERIGVCRDFAHLAVTLCRCMNIPARYCTGYLGDIGVPKDPAPMDFSAWFEVFLAGRWFTFDARHNRPRIGRIVMARGRDAADVAISTAFGPAQLARFNVVTEELADKDYSPRNLQNQPTPDPVGRWTEIAKSPAPCGAGLAMNGAIAQAIDIFRAEAFDPLQPSL